MGWFLRQFVEDLFAAFDAGFTEDAAWVRRGWRRLVCWLRGHRPAHHVPLDVCMRCGRTLS